ncbi:putative Head decoration protein [Candidatus Magnetomoraceae bacterium gMMP-15]
MDSTLQNFSIKSEAIAAPGHEVVILSEPVPEATEDIEKGTIVSLNADDKIVPYSAVESDIFGVLPEKYFEGQEVANVIVHGTVRRDLLIEDGGAVSTAVINILIIKGIYPI